MQIDPGPTSRSVSVLMDQGYGGDLKTKTNARERQRNYSDLIKIEKNKFLFMDAQQNFILLLNAMNKFHLKISKNVLY